jgi:hypothetical protein
VPETSFLGRNYSRYASPAMDALLDAYFTTIPWDQRMSVAREIVRLMTDQVIWMDLFYDAQPTLVSSRLGRVTAVSPGPVVWNAHEWESN